MAQPGHIPLELLQTFVRITEFDGDATSAAQDLDISQPTISKRMSNLRKLTSDPNGQPWLVLKGKRWKVTNEGNRVRGVVTDLVRRYEQMEQFVESQQKRKPMISLACGQQAATGIVKTAVEALFNAQPDCRVRISTLRGKARIEGVAGGQFDLALVTNTPAEIHRIAQIELYTEMLLEDSLVLIANPRANSAWTEQWQGLPIDQPITARQLLGMPFILPEPDSARRQQFDEWTYRATGQLLDVVLETGGWETILCMAQAGLGVGLVSSSIAATLTDQQAKQFSVRELSAKDFPPDAVRLITRKAHGSETPALDDLARQLSTLLRQAAAGKADG